MSTEVTEKTIEKRLEEAGFEDVNAVQKRQYGNREKIIFWADPEE